ncbi:uncharacterized protein LOC115213946 isoform X3 [Octopus sinensis]|uniref:Uncharacterized protein LOC115213946 isoform X3 n=1 Tax=Octopus sinensis TaxID=2607531 RepID=A0A7E6F063_9MOLL|nr:uncharacterized protein LOC115213946 isoform X3 [Octopus sinensis]
MCTPSYLFLVLFIAFTDKIKGIWSDCQFPDYLQSPSYDAKLKPWGTRMWWLNGRGQPPKWVERQEVYVSGGVIWRYKEFPTKRCEGLIKHRLWECPDSREMLYNRTCLMKERSDTYRVIEHYPVRSHSPNAIPKFTCMKFLQRTKNVVQVFERPPTDTNAPDLCDEKYLRLDDWPWVASIKSEQFFCPVSGGFTYRTINRLINEDVCEHEWRRSRLEIECVKGDGLDFIAPRGSGCSPFPRGQQLDNSIYSRKKFVKNRYSRRRRKKRSPFLDTSASKISEEESEATTHFVNNRAVRLDCWGGWEEGDYIYLVAAPSGQKPQYCMRFPKRMHGEFSIFIYFSVICPSESDGIPPHGIEYYELKAQQSDPWNCEDDHEECREIMRRGRCTKEGGKYYLHCQRSCGLCGVREESKQRCEFADKYVGKWMLYEEEYNEQVVINKTHISFSKLGSFRCEELNPYKEKYKVSSVFPNGCSQRYTCIEFNRRNNNLLQYRIGKFRRMNLPLDQLCVFNDDTYPWMESGWSYHMKNLIQMENLWPSYCGLESSIPFSGTYDGQYCEGTIGDWNENTCLTESSLILRSDTCSALLIPQEFECLAFLNEQNGLIDNLVITRSKDGKNEFNCWVITSSRRINSTWLNNDIYRMKSVQCSSMPDIEVLSSRKPKASLYLQDNAKSRFCKPYTQSTRSSSNEPKSGLHSDLSTRTLSNVPRQSTQHYYKPDVPGANQIGRATGHASISISSISILMSICWTAVLLLFSLS